MTQYEIGELDLTAQVSAAQSATNYIHADSSGIRIASANPATQNQRLELTNNNAIFYDKDGKKRTQVDNNGLHIFDASSTPVEVALFGSTVGTTGTTAFARIGKANNESHMELDYHSMQLIDKEGKTYFHISDLRETDGEAIITETFKGNGITKEFQVQFPISSEISAEDNSDSQNTATVDLNTGTYTFTKAPPLNYEAIIVYKTTSREAKGFTWGERVTDSTIGAYSFAEGYDVTASGKYSHAEGGSTIASGSHSHAEGDTTEASGVHSHAEGESTKALGFNSHAEGDLTIANGESSHAEGRNTTANGDYSHTEGHNTTANGDYSHAEGYYTKANENYSHAEGRNTKANGLYSHAEGYSTEANGESSHAEGYSTEANGNYSHAEGYDTEVNGLYSHAEGFITKANGLYSHAEGSGTNANGNYSHAEGRDTIANGNYSHAQNYGTIASSNYQTSLGSFNIEDLSDTYAIIIGNGTASNARSNALTVDWNGKVIANGVNLIGTDVESTTNYPGIVFSDGTSNQWLRTTTNGIIPVSADSTNGKSSIGTSGWPFANGYFKKINGVIPVLTDTTALGSMTGTLGIAHGGTGATTAANARTNLGLGDSGWQTLTLASGWTAYDTTQTPKYRKIGSLVEICGAVKPTATTTLNDTATVFGTLPTGYRPAVNKFVLCQASGVKSWLLGAYANGNVTAARLRAQNSTSYQTAATTEWLVFNIMYFVD